MSGVVPQARLAGRRVLILEDEYFVADELAEAFGRAGATVVGPFATVEAALTALEGASDLHFAILDVNLRGDRSYAVAEALKALGVPFVFLTGYDSLALDPAWADAPRFQKPLDAGRLIGLLQI